MLDPDSIHSSLSRFPCRNIDDDGLRPAAVLLLFYQRDGEDYFLFTRRTEHMPHHRGEISFPGGKRHSGAIDLQETALRETEEEMGIRREDVTILGRLDDFISFHGYHIVPFVGTFPYPYPFQADPREIAEVLEVPLRLLLDPDLVREEDWSHRGRYYPVHFFTVGRHEIWGLTAAILRQFLRRAGISDTTGAKPCKRSGDR